MASHPVRAAALGLALALVGKAAAAQDASCGGQDPVGRLASALGDVRINGRAPTGALPFVPLCEGDLVTVGVESRATAYLLAADTPFRIDEATSVRLLAPDQPSSGLLDLTGGALYFLSEVRRTLTIRTPYISAGVEGTEVYLRVADAGAELIVLEGAVALTPGARMPADTVLAPAATGDRVVVDARGEAERGVVPGDGPFGALRRVVVGQLSWTLYYPDVLPGVEAAADPRLPEAARLLAAGQVEPARALLAAIPDNGQAAGLRDALLTSIAVARGDEAEASRLAGAAVAAAPGLAAPQLASSYARQLALDLDGAVAAADKASRLALASPLAQARLAELYLMRGEIRQARSAAARAVELGGGPLAGIVQGFADLAALRGARAEQSFRRALAQESQNPLALLGLGLSQIKQGDLPAGRQQIESAVVHDPASSLLRSYLGKAYFEERRDAPSGKQYAIAKELDPTDPTPWLYNATRLQLDNQPIQALANVERSIELNNNRAPFRSRLLLARDASSRGAALGRIYSDLGFTRLGRDVAADALFADPANPGAHRFLADMYLTRPRSEFAYFSERLQTLMLQPPLRAPVPPQLALSDLSEVATVGPLRIGFNEFTSAFEQDGIGLAASTRVGSQDTRNGEIVISSLAENVALSLGALRAQNDGFRANNEVRREVYDAFAQWAPTPEFSIQAEFRSRELDRGNLVFDVDPDQIDDSEKAHVDEHTGRIGAHFQPSPSDDVLVSLALSDRDTTDIFEDFEDESHENGGQFEVQYQRHFGHADLISGFGAYRFNLGNDQDYHQTFGYIIANVQPLSGLEATLGLSFDSYKDQRLDVDSQDLGPQLGLIYRPIDRVTLRAAYGRQRKPRLIAKEMLVPTQIAGFTRFFDDPNGSLADLYGAGLDLVLHENAAGNGDLFAGMEVSRRDIDRPFLPPAVPGSGPSKATDDLNEDVISGYLYALPTRQIALTFTPSYETTKCDDSCSPITRVSTWLLPAGARYFHPLGFYGLVEYNWITQDVRRSGGSEDSKSFGTLDFALGWRLPQYVGAIQLTVRNALDTHFDYQDDSFRATDPLQSRFVPERSLFVSATVQF